MSNPHDIAYLAGYDDGSRTVGYLTVRLFAAYTVIGLLLLVIVYLTGRIRHDLGS